MAKFCTKCGRRLEEGEICSCTLANQDQSQPMYGQTMQEQYYNQSQQGGQYSDTNQQNQYYNQDQQGEQYYNANQQNQYYNQGQQGGQYYDANQQNQYYNQGQQGGQYYDANQQNQYYNQGQQGGQYYNPNQQNQQYGQGAQGQYYQQRTKEAEWLFNKKDQLVSGTKNMFSEILPILKAPVTRVKAIADSKNPAVGIEFIVTKMVVCILFLMIFLMKLKNAAGVFGDYIKIPYLKCILWVIVVTVGIDLLDAVLMKLITALFGGRTTFPAYIDVVGASDMYATFAIIIVGILLAIAPEIGMLFLGVCAPLVTYVKFAGYRAVADIDEDKKPYAYFVAKLCFSIVVGLVVYLMVRSIMNSAVGGAMNGLQDLFGSIL